MQGKLTPEGNDLIERLKATKGPHNVVRVCFDAATALSQAQAEGEELRFVVAVMGACAENTMKWCGRASTLIALKDANHEIATSALTQATARIKEVEAMLVECADDLETEIQGRASGELPRRIERDMETVRRARHLIQGDRGS